MSSINFVRRNNKIEDGPIASRIVNEIPADETCILFLAGSAIIDNGPASKLADTIANEVLQGVSDIPNYTFIYNDISKENLKRTVAQRLILFDKYQKNILPSEDNNKIYVSLENAERVFKQKIEPRIKQFGRQATGEMQFIADGDKEQILAVFEYNLNKMNLPESDTVALMSNLRKETYSYATHYDPKYIDNLFKNVLLPRITDTNGNKLPIEIAQKRVRKLNILAHCHGAYVATVLAEKMQNTMKKLGYTPNEIEAVQSQMLVVALTPSCPLGVTKMQVISFMSAYDTMVERPNNWVSQYVTENRKCDLDNIQKDKTKHLWDLKIGFLSDRNGNVFYAKQRYNLEEKDTDIGKKISWNEHNSSHFVSEHFTDDGRLLAKLARNIIVSGIKNSEAQDDKFVPLPPIEELILDGKNDKYILDTFNKMKQNGRDFLKTVCNYAKEKIKKLMPNKISPKSTSFDHS